MKKRVLGAFKLLLVKHPEQQILGLWATGGEENWSFIQNSNINMKLVQLDR